MPRTQNPNDLCWIHIKDVYSFLNLGANPHERKVGQNIRFDLSVQMPYRGTRDQLSNTIDYSQLIQRLQEYIVGLEPVNLLEHLAENILDLIGQEFSDIHAAKLIVYKAFVPLAHFSGSVAIEATRTYEAL